MPECDVPVPGIPGTGNSRYREFSFFLVVSEPVSEKFGTGKSTGTGIGKIWYRKKVPVSVSEKFGTGIGIGKIWYRKKYRNWYRKKINIKKRLCFSFLSCYPDIPS